MKYENVYFINGVAYAGKSTMVKSLAKKYNGIACEENYTDQLINDLDSKQFPYLTYTRDIKDWSEFVRRTPDEYEQWINGVNEECTILEQKILDELIKQNKPIFVDTNITLDVLKEISDKDHVLIMLANQDISINRFFERKDREKQFIYQLLMRENDPEAAKNNFKNCLKRINSKENYLKFYNSGFNVLLRDDNRTVDETLLIVEKLFKLV